MESIGQKSGTGVIVRGRSGTKRIPLTRGMRNADGVDEVILAREVQVMDDA